MKLVLEILSANSLRSLRDFTRECFCFAFVPDFPVYLATPLKALRVRSWVQARKKYRSPPYFFIRPASDATLKAPYSRVFQTPFPGSLRETKEREPRD